MNKKNVNGSFLIIIIISLLIISGCSQTIDKEESINNVGNINNTIPITKDNSIEVTIVRVFEDYSYNEPFIYTKDSHIIIFVQDNANIADEPGEIVYRNDIKNIKTLPIKVKIPKEILLEDNSYSISAQMISGPENSVSKAGDLLNDVYTEINSDMDTLTLEIIGID